jgi:hypothetical protein
MDQSKGIGYPLTGYDTSPVKIYPDWKVVRGRLKD